MHCHLRTLAFFHPLPERIPRNSALLCNIFSRAVEDLPQPRGAGKELFSSRGDGEIVENESFIGHGFPPVLCPRPLPEREFLLLIQLDDVDGRAGTGTQGGETGQVVAREATAPRARTERQRAD